METGMMRETSRQALLLGGQPLEGIAALSMPQYAWQFRRTSCLVEAEALLTSSPPPLGVILLEGLQASAPPAPGKSAQSGSGSAVGRTVSPPESPGRTDGEVHRPVLPCLPSATPAPRPG